MNDIIISWIKNQRLRNRTWNWIRNVGKPTEEELINFLNERETIDFWDPLTPEEWRELVNEQERQSEIIERINDESGATVLGSANEDNTIVIPTNEDSAWQCYKQKLRSDGFGLQSIEAIENSTIKILRHLSRDTTDIGPIKGLVVGNVQSGKTANMAALMAMAADNGWNMFIILSGIIDNLRIQTQNRLNDDLNFGFGARSRYNWQPIDYSRTSGEAGRRISDFNLQDNSTLRYFAVCLKNATLLRNLLGWLERGGERRNNIKLLIIDDEADQAGINTNPSTRTTINRLILNIVNDRNAKGKIVEDKFRAVNYIGYTATPYANVLNEIPGPDSLYPSNFIATLAVSDEYFGPQQIFGCSNTDFTGLNIVRTIPDDQIRVVHDIHNNQITDIPTDLKDAICWFLCGVSCMRLWENTQPNRRRKPISMMIHTSIRTDHHAAIAGAIEQWIRNTNNDTILDICNAVWNRERNAFNENLFRMQYPNYNGYNGGATIRPLPIFDDIRQGIISLLEIGITNIQINDDNERIYSTGIHLCVDNSADNNIMRRLLYPDAGNMPNVAPAFIVVGGQTLSRGLTIEGLISTFFLRSTINSDTLMQMGRWFGYRRGYELLPRIWMSGRAREQFEFISEMDYSLRQEIKQMADTGTDFSEVGPRIIPSPQAGLIRIVSSNRMRGAITADFDFSGRTMETGVFANDREMLEQNLNTTISFIRALGNPSNMAHINSHNYLWTGIGLPIIREFLRNYRYSERLRGFNDLDPLISWLDNFTEEGLIGEWNVILAGKQNGENRWEPIPGISVNKVDHTQRGERRGNTINIGVLRSPNDFVTDIPSTEEQEVRNVINNSHRLTDINNLRERNGLNRTPQLIIYVINRDSQPRQGAQNRFPLNAEEDIVGFCINIPGRQIGSNPRLSVRINIPPANRID